jgi:phosphoglycerate kinase
MQTHLNQISEINSKNFPNKTALVRVDFNVPLTKNQGRTQVVDDTRIRCALKTITFLLEKQFRVVLLTHLGRPKGLPNLEYSVEPIVAVLESLLKHEVCLAPDIQAAKNCLTANKNVILLENIRFFEGEEKNDLVFAKELATIADIYVNEAFSTAHRNHASIVQLPHLLPSYIGFSFAQEIKMLQMLMTEPKRPFVMVIGGAKISDKVDAVRNLANIADAVLIGGGTANNFLKAEGVDVCKSLVEEPTNVPNKDKKNQRSVNYVEVAQDMIEKTRTHKILLDGYIPIPKIILPIDVVAAPNLDSNESEIIDLINCTAVDSSKRDLMYLDIGPKTLKLFKEILLQAGTIFWNGPMGVFEKKQFASGTREVAQTIAKAGATTILGGGDTIASIRTFSEENRYDYVSSAGGAALAFLAGKELPGIHALKNRSQNRKAKNSKNT